MAKTTAMTESDKGPKSMVVFDYGEDAGKGYEHQTRADTSIPFLKQLQPTSPLVAEGIGKPGDWYNTVTNEVYDRDKGFYFVASSTRHRMAVWAPRETGGSGGFQGHREMDDPVTLKAVKTAAKFGKNKDDDGNSLNETFYVYGVLCSAEGEAIGMAVLPFWSTKIKAYKAWMTRMRSFTVPTPNGQMIKPPLFAHLSRISSVQTKNDKGTFFIPVVSPGNPQGMMQSLLKTDDPRFVMAKACMILVDSDELDKKIDFAKSRDTGDETELEEPAF